MVSAKYRTIVADPPWAYDEGWPPNRFGVDATTIDAPRNKLPYGAMTLQEIAELPIADLADRDSHLLLWTTNRYIEQSYGLVRGWGFRPSQLLTWCKPACGIGPGGVFSSTSEFVLYARRGKPEHIKRTDSTWWFWPRHGHSVKPEAFLDLVEQIFPGPYLEMFARRNRLGWDTWGNECLEHVEVTVGD